MKLTHEVHVFKSCLYALLFLFGLPQIYAATDTLVHLNLENQTIDVSGSNNNGTANALTFEKDAPAITIPNDYSARFNGQNAFISIPHQPALNSYPLTLSAWIKTSQTVGLNGIIKKYAYGSKNGYQLYTYNGNIYAWYFKDANNFVWNSTLAVGMNGGPIADGEWHHVAFTVDSTGGKIYVDGNLKSSLAWKGTAGAANNTQPVEMGRYTQYFNGLIDEPTIFNRSLSAPEIAILSQKTLLLHLNMENSANDLSGRNFNGTVQGGAIFENNPAPTAFSNAYSLSLDGINDFITVPHHSDLNSYPISISAWIKTTKTTGFNGIVSKYIYGSKNGYQLFTSNGMIYGRYFKNSTSYIWDGATGLSGGPVSDGKWHHVAFTVDAAGGKIYVDGLLKGTRAWTGSPGATTQTDRLSIGFYDQYFSGSIDEARIYKITLTADEIVTLAKQRQNNNPPQVYAGNDQTIAVADVSLRATVTDDGLPTPPGTTTLSWSQISGPGSITFTNTSSTSPSGTFSQPGTYVLRLTASDGELSATDDVMITYELPPVDDGGTTGSSGIVPLTLSTTLEMPFMVSSGVPLPRGSVMTLDQLKLIDANGSEIPAQFESLAKWPDTSVKSVLVITHASLTSTYKLSFGSGVTRSAYTTGLSITEDTTSISVSTGPLKFTLKRAAFNLFDEVWRDIDGDGAFADHERVQGQGGDIFLVNAFDNLKYLSSLFPNPSYVIEESGPMRVVIRASGKLQASSGKTLTDFIVRIYAYANQDYVNVDYTLVDTREEADVQAARAQLALSVSGYGVQLPFRITNDTTYSFGGETSTHTGPLSGSKFLFQNGTLSYVDGVLKPFTFGYSGVGTGTKAPGWFDLSGPNFGVSAMVKDFWQQFPKELAIENNQLMIYLHPLRASVPSPDLKYPALDSVTKKYVRPNTFYSPREGMAKTYQMLFQFHDAVANPALTNKTFQSRPRLLAAPSWYATSQVFGNILEGGLWSKGYDQYLLDGIYWPSIGVSKATGSITFPYGWRDFGDRIRPGYIGESNTVKQMGFYNDTHVGAHNFLIQYLRTLNEKWWELGEIATRHWMDIDVSHTNRKGYWKNSSFAYVGLGPGEGHMIKHDILDHSSRNIHFGHAHLSGLQEYYLLTGDRRALEVIKEVGDWWANMAPIKFPVPVPNPHYAEAERDYAWPLWTLCEVYRVTGDKKYLEAAAQIVRHLIGWWQTPTQHFVNGVVVGQNDSTKGTGWWYMYPQMDNSPTPPAGKVLYNGTNPWMAGALLAAVIEFREHNKDHNLVDDALLTEMLFQTMNYVVKYGWDDTKRYFTYSYFVYAEPAHDTDGGINHILFPLAYLGNMVIKGEAPHPDWYGTSSLWLRICKRKYDDWKIVKSRGTTSLGFYGYEEIHSAAFWKIMNDLEKDGTLAGIQPNT
jgi:hypothetical protein